MRYNYSSITGEINSNPTASRTSGSSTINAATRAVEAARKWSGPNGFAPTSISTNPTAGQSAPKVIRGVNGDVTVYGQTPSLSDWQGETYNDLSASENAGMFGEGDTGSNTGGDTGGGFNVGGLFGAMGTAITGTTAALGKQYDDEGFQLEQNISSAASAFGPYGMLASGIASLSSQVTRAADMDTKHMTERARKAAGVSKAAQVGNNVMSWLNNTTFGASWTSFTGIPIWGTSANMAKTGKYTMSREADDLSGAYAGTTEEMRGGEDASNGRFYFGKRKLNDLVNKSVKNDNLLYQIGIDNEQRVSSVPYNAEMIASRNFKKMYGMTGQSYGTRVGKQGMKLISREELDRIYAAKKLKEMDIPKFQNGGSILVPEGALHAHKHHMEEVNPDLAEDLTKKGIPVVAVDENGEVQQVAEIEKQELIFEKDLTEKIEKLWKDGSDEAMIEAGKIITYTLLTNCDDNAGLVKEVE